MKFTIGLAVLTLASQPSVSFAETANDREGSVREDKSTLEKDARWIYTDWEKGHAVGKRSGKPDLVVLRCVSAERRESKIPVHAGDRSVVVPIALILFRGQMRIGVHREDG